MADRDLWDRLRDGAEGAIESLDDEPTNPLLMQKNAATLGLNALKGFFLGFTQGKDTGTKWVPRVQTVQPTRPTAPMPTMQKPYEGTAGTRFMGEERVNGKKFYLYEDPNTGRRIKTDDKGNIIWSRWTA